MGLRSLPYLLLSGLLFFVGCASNIRDTDLLASNILMLPPADVKKVFIQNRNTSDNQAVTLSDLEARLAGKGYEIVQDPNAAQGLAGMASMAGPHGAIAGSAASMGLGAIGSIGSAVGNMFGDSFRPHANDNVEYACVADLQ